MEREEIADLVKGIIADIAPDEEEGLKKLDYSKPIREQLPLDSMDFLDIVMELRKRYKVDVPEPEYINLRTMNSCIEYIGPKLKKE